MQKNPEDRFQHEYVMFYGQTWPEHYDRLFEINNNPKNEAHGAHRKAMGMKKNVSDLILQRPEHGQMVGIELKAPGSTWPRLKIQNQLNWGLETIKQGGFYIMTSDMGLLKKFTIALMNDDIETVHIIQAVALTFVKTQLKNKTIKF